ncbi:unnamed protein product [Penicillium camemberti]|uniref:Str. FM013 n=1 Tax=Penicillium camemberti (strain FM 013) TaxID=1429867 RepID=A0A0G4PMK5_PENC3|nr:unnamed protein product [Penicillium camemberti]
MHIQSVKKLAMESHSYRLAVPTLASLKPTYTQAIGFRTSQALYDEGSRLDVIPVSKQFPLSALYLPLYCDLLLHSSSLVSALSDEPTTESKHNGAITEKGLITGAIRGSYTSTATKTSDHEWHDTAIYGSNLSARLSKQGAVLILSSVFRGSVALIGVFIIHCFILRYLHGHAMGSTSLVPSQRVVDSSEKRANVIPRTAEFSHFSNDT